MSEGVFCANLASTPWRGRSMPGSGFVSPNWVRDHRHRFKDAGAGVRPPDSDLPGRGPPDKSQRALAGAGFVDGPDVPRSVLREGMGWFDQGATACRQFRDL